LTRYDVELFQKIELLTGLKMEQFEAERDAALVLLDGVNEAQRIATMQVAPLFVHLPGKVVCR
jgi:ATP-dependent RNA helicase DDX47/RRP3